jgi:hypothetical protein
LCLGQVIAYAKWGEKNTKVTIYAGREKEREKEKYDKKKEGKKEVKKKESNEKVP